MRADPAFTSYSANFEDVVLHRIFGGQAQGSYLDAGASDPVRGNDTKALYDRGWSGVNLVDVALLPRFMQARPRDRTLDATPPDTGRVDLVRLAGAAASREALRGEDWERLSPDVVVAEATDRRTGRRGEGLAAVLEPRGYALAHFDGLNEFHVKHGFRGADGAFALPPNLFDRFVPYRPDAGSPDSDAGRLALDNADLRHETERLRASVAALTADMLALNRDLEAGLAERAELHGLRGAAEECSRLRPRVEELDDYARRVEAHARDTEAHARHLEADLGRVRAELDHLRGLYEFMTVQHGHVSNLHGQALARREQAEAELRRMAELREQDHALYEQERALHERERALRQALQSSTSWRLTRPLRAVMGRVRRR